MNRAEFIKKYSEKFYLGDGLFARFDGFNIILSTERENGEHYVGLEPEVFDRLIRYREDVYEDAKNITKE
jgi:hypothetical protein